MFNNAGMYYDLLCNSISEEINVYICIHVCMTVCAKDVHACKQVKHADIIICNSCMTLINWSA